MNSLLADNSHAMSSLIILLKIATKFVNVVRPVLGGALRDSRTFDLFACKCHLLITFANSLESHDPDQTYGHVRA